MEAANRKNKRINLFCYNEMGMLTLLVLTCSIFITIGVAFKPFMIIGFGVAAGAIIVAKEDWKITAILIALLNLSNIFKLEHGSTSFFTYLEIIAIIKYISINYHFDSKFIIAWGVYAVYVFVGCGSNIVPFIKVVIAPLLFFLMIRNVSYQQLLYISCYYMVGVAISSLVALTKDVIPNMNNFIIHGDAFLGEKSGIVSDVRFSGTLGDPNYYAVHLLLSVAISIFLITRKEIKPITFILVCSFMAIFGGMTGSKSFFLSLIALCIFFIYTLIKNEHFFLCTIVLAMGIILFYLIQSGTINIFSTALTRLQLINSGNTDLTTGRSALWSLYFEGILNDPLKAFFGNGVSKGYSFSMVPHNTIIDFIDLLGILGTSIFLFMIITISKSIKIITIEKQEELLQPSKYIKESKQESLKKTKAQLQMTRKNNSSGKEHLSHKSSIIFFLPLITLCILYFFLSMFYSEDMVFELLLAISYVRIYENFENKDITMTYKFLRMD